MNGKFPALYEQLVQDFMRSEKQYSIIMILPESGCSGCISSAEKFVFENYKSNDLMIIFTGIRSKKLLQIRLNYFDKIPSNIHFDEDNLYALDSKEEGSIYPAIIYTENKKIKKIEYVCPDNPDALNNLKSILSKKQTEYIDIEDIIHTKKLPDFQLEDIIKDKRHIYLNSDKPVDLILNVVVKDNFIFVFAKSKRILVFDSNGQFFSLINKMGRGPKEYSKLLSFDVHPSKDEIYILDYKKIIVYDFYGNYIKHIETNEIALDFCILNDGSFLIYFPFLNVSEESNYYKQSWINLDSDGKIIKEILTRNSFKQKNQAMIYSPYIQKSFDGVYFSLPQEYSIYKLADNKLQKVLNYNHSKLLMSEELSKSLSEKKMNFINQLLISVNPKYFFIKFFFNNSWYYSIYSRELNTFNSAYNQLSYSQLEMDRIKISWPIFHKANNAISIDYPPFNNYFQKHISNIDKLNNPVLTLYTFK